jgi:hypothetical protein
MRMQEDEVRKIFIKIRVNEAEVSLIKKLQQQSTETSLSNYIRKVASQKPVIVKYRNQTADDFLKEMIRLKKELNDIGSNFNQVVQKLQMLEKIPEFRAWIKLYQDLQLTVASKIQEINLKVNQLHDQWLRK